MDEIKKNEEMKQRRRNKLKKERGEIKMINYVDMIKVEKKKKKKGLEDKEWVEENKSDENKNKKHGL